MTTRIQALFCVLMSAAFLYLVGVEQSVAYRVTWAVIASLLFSAAVVHLIDVEKGDS